MKNLILIISVCTSLLFSCKKDDVQEPVADCNCDLIRETKRQGMVQKREVLKEGVCKDDSTTGSVKNGDIETNVYWECE